ncbi:SDR family oxidoreductase [Clostridium sp. SM-530-WT-3G]|uniref:SDR family NAD(P)-dependent oxidoreductase n=1 Tax=Clostridium sp. SM-530-WT-3G TaxID=2725303 RepID=UPI00145C3D76|nr:SDR family oxidoreductase [Clostridium sp. SM-530-WT-3G]NME83748.1 SDR family oxidoreductase [Clostridium sp. SM-530-WT-3G]
MGIKLLIKRTINLFKEKKIIPIQHYVHANQILKGQVALISGGSGGIGFAIAKKFIESGCKVIIAGTKEEKLKKCVDELGSSCSYIILNLYNVSEFQNKIQEAEEKFGNINILVNCAGIHIPRNDLAFLNIDENEYDTIMDLNLKGTYFLSQELAKRMIERKIKGHILMISSQSGLEPAWSPYRLSKWGIKALTEGLAQSLLNYGIIVNGIGPGPTATSMQPYKKGDSIYTNQNPIKRYTMPEEVAEYAVILTSSLGDTVVGDTLYMSGGRGIIELR